MNIEIDDTGLEARIQKLLQATGSSSIEEVSLRLVETQEEQDRWLLENRATVHAKIRTAIDRLDRGEGIPGRSIGRPPGKAEKPNLNERALCSCSAGTKPGDTSKNNPD